jgi:hypothetical protein
MGRSRPGERTYDQPIGKHPIPERRLSITVRLMDATRDLAYYLAEWYLPEMTATSVDEMVAKLDAAAAAISTGGTPVRLVVTLSVPTDEVLYGVFGAPSPDIVSQTCLRAGVPFQRISGDVGARIQPTPAAEVAGSATL